MFHCTQPCCCSSQKFSDDKILCLFSSGWNWLKCRFLRSCSWAVWTRKMYFWKVWEQKSNIFIFIWEKGKKGSDLIYLNSPLCWLHMSLEHLVLNWLSKHARALLKSHCVYCVCLLVCTRLTLMELNIQIDICCGCVWQSVLIFLYWMKPETENKSFWHVHNSSSPSENVGIY